MQRRGDHGDRDKSEADSARDRRQMEKRCAHQ
jgi:hypothetical protein